MTYRILKFLQLHLANSCNRDSTRSRFATAPYATRQFNRINRTKHNPYRRAIASLTGLLILATTTTALAQYKPPRDQRPPRSNTTTTGTRGSCDQSSKAGLTLLAPSLHVGQTTATHPTFAWFMPNASPSPMQFILYERNSNEELSVIYQAALLSSPGITTLTLPRDQSALVKGKSYVWQVAMICEPTHPANAKIASTEIDIVEMPSNLSEALVGKEGASIVNLYAQSGLWYDALTKALELTRESPGKESLNNLLQSLVQVEADKGTATTSKL